jgi:uncharacterized phage protein (TIGR02218 family)
MKAASSTLLTLLNSGVNVQRFDLWTLTLNGGAVIRWSGEDQVLVANGNSYALGPAINRGSITAKRGLEVATLDVTIIANADDTVNGVPLIQFVAGHGLDLANVSLDYGYAASTSDPVVGTINAFTGRVTSVPSIIGNQIQFTVSAWTVLMDAQMPTNLYQVGCIHTVYDTGCAILASSFSASGTVSGTPTRTGFSSGLTGIASDYSQGKVVFTSGGNAGLGATVRSYDGAGNFGLIAPLPVAPAAGDTFTAYKGCDQTKATCVARFNNLIHFRGFPTIPVPETAY